MAIKNPAPYKKIQRAYARKSKVKSKAYIKTIPPSHLLKYVMGNQNKFNNGGYKKVVKIVSKENAQLRDVSLEAIRNLIHRELENELGSDYYFRILTAPHQVLREHKQASVAQADRISAGMSLSFGKSVGRAARLYKGKAFLLFGFNSDEDIAKFRKIFSKAKAKLSIPVSIDVK